MKAFTKTLLAAAMALAATGAAEARIANTAQPTTYEGSELVLTVWDLTAQKSYTLDLGVTQAAFLGGSISGLNRTVADSNLTAFLSTVAVGNDVRYSVNSGSSSLSTITATFVSTGLYTGMTKKAASLTSYGLVTSGNGTLAEFAAVTNSSTKINAATSAGANNASNVNSATGQAAAADSVNVSLSAALGDVGYAGAAWGTNMGGTLGAFSSMAALGDSTSMFRASLNPLLTSQAVAMEFTNVLNFSVAGGVGTLSYVSAVPVPAAVWMFGAGLMGVLRLNRRKVAA